MIEAVPTGGTDDWNSVPFFIFYFSWEFVKVEPDNNTKGMGNPTIVVSPVENVGDTLYLS